MRNFAFVTILAAISSSVLAVNLNKDGPKLDTDNIDFNWAKNAVESGGYQDPHVYDAEEEARKQAAAEKRVAAYKAEQAAKKATEEEAAAAKADAAKVTAAKAAAKTAKNRVDTTPTNVKDTITKLDPATKVDKSRVNVKKTITALD